MNAMIAVPHPELIARPFANWPAALPLPQDAIRERMIASLRGKASLKEAKAPKMPKPPSSAHQEFMDRRKAERDALMPKVREMAARGMNQTQIAAKIGASRGFVARIFSEAGIKTISANEQKSWEAAEARARLAPVIEAMLAEGKSRIAVAAELGVDRNFVGRIVKEAGI